MFLWCSDVVRPDNSCVGMVTKLDRLPDWGIQREEHRSSSDYQHFQWLHLYGSSHWSHCCWLFLWNHPCYLSFCFRFSYRRISADTNSCAWLFKTQPLWHCFKPMPITFEKPARCSLYGHNSSLYRNRWDTVYFSSRWCEPVREN